MSEDNFTNPHDFYQCNREGQQLFSVKPQIPKADALEAATVMVEAVSLGLSQLALDADTNPNRSVNVGTAYSLSYTLEMALAALQSVDLESRTDTK